MELGKFMSKWTMDPFSTFFKFLSKATDVDLGLFFKVILDGLLRFFLQELIYFYIDC